MQTFMRDIFQAVKVRFIKYHLKPFVREQPNYIVLHVGAIDLDLIEHQI